MTDARDEQPQRGTGSFSDVVDVQVLDESLLVAARIARRPADESATATVLAVDAEARVFALDETAGPVETWDEALVGPLQLETVEPLERWRLALSAPDVRLDLELHAAGAPVALADPATAVPARAAGIHRYTQLCRAQGTAELGGRRRTMDAMAIRTHRWGPVGDGGRTRFLTAGTEDGALLSIVAVGPADGTPHGEELLAGRLTEATQETEPGPDAFETVRVSTVYGDGGLPVKTGVELFRPGDELPSRLAGVAADGVPTRLGGAPGSLSLFRFRLDGVAAMGSYEIEGGG